MMRLLKLCVSFAVGCVVFEAFLCLAAEVVPQRAAHRAGEEGGAGCSLPERESPLFYEQ